MHVTVDLSRCQGYGNCVQSAPEIFDLDEASGQAIVLHADPPPNLHAAAREAESLCPAAAIMVEDAG